MARVVNLYKEPYTVYIGRAGKGKDGYFGNPIRIGFPCPVCNETHKNGGETLPCYRRDLWHRLQNDPEFRRRVKELESEVLGCFCKPKPCHGDILVKAIAWLNKEDR